MPASPRDEASGRGPADKKQPVARPPVAKEQEAPATMVCPSCRRRIKLPETAEVGRYVRCPHCREPMLVKRAPLQAGSKTSLSSASATLAEKGRLSQPAGTTERIDRESIPASSNPPTRQWFLWSGLLTLGLAASVAGWSFLHHPEKPSVAEDTPAFEPPHDTPPAAPEPAPAPLFLPIPDVTLKPGGSRGIAVAVERNAFQGPATLQLDGLPDKVAARTPVLAAEENSVDLELIAASDAPAATAVVKVRLMDGSKLLTEGQVRISVLEPMLLQLMAISQVTLKSGESQLLRVQVKRQGFQGPVTLEVEGLSDRVTTSSGTVPAGQDFGQLKLTTKTETRPGILVGQIVARFGDLSTRELLTIRVEKGAPTPAAPVVKNPETDPGTVQLGPGQERVLTGHRDVVLGVSISPDSKYVLSASGGGWDGKTIVAGTENTLKLWDLERNREIPFRFPRQTHPLHGVAYSPKGRYAVTGGADGFVRMWEVDKGKEWLPHNKPAHTDEIMSVAFAPDGRFVVSGSKDKTVRTWDVQTGHPGPVFQGHTDWVESVAVSPDGRSVLSGSVDKTARWWDLATGQQKQQFTGHKTAVTCVAFAPDGKQALSGGADRLVRLWDLETGQEIRSFQGHELLVMSVAFTPRGDRFVSCGFDGTVRLWDVATGKELQKFKGHTQLAWSVAVSPDGALAVSGGVDQTVRVWTLPK